MSVSPITLEGKVAIVTGGARGLGRVEALALAKAGARVVVNDLGGSADGQGRDEGPAREVVDEIKSAGGEAVAHFGDVADWNDAQALIKTAVDELGGLDILVNNAGFLRDATIFNMSEEDFDSVVRVHLKGHFCTCRFATAYWREQSKAQGGPVYGRVINKSSEAFLFGNVGQPNYAAAKGGVVAITLGIAQACLKYGVTANAVMPRARTRMNDSGPWSAIFAKPEDGFDTFAPENVAPLTVYLASPEAARISGQLFLIWGQTVQVMHRPEVDSRFDAPGGDRWTADALHAELGPFYEKREPVNDGFLVPPA